ncbi:MAG: exonuclease domain-containing protein [Candidatus Rokuibacteriota bacterium]
MRLERKLTLGVLGLAVLPGAAAGLVLLLLLHHADLRGSPALLVGALIALGAITLSVALAAHRLGRSLVRALEKLQHGAELMSTVNPEHRLDVRSADGLQALAHEINRLGDHLRAARHGVDERVAAATRELRIERRLLSGVLGELAEGVLVAGADRRVTLANRIAAGLLADGEALLGRQLEELVDRETIDRHLRMLHEGRDGAERFALRTARGAALQAAMTVLLDEEGRPSGIILALRDPAHAPGADGAEADGADRLVGAGVHSGTAAALPGPARPELYDFSLFDEMAPAVTPVEREHRLDELTFVVFDTETTGLRPEAGDRVVSLAGVRVRGGRARRHEAFDALVDPGRSVPAESVAFHGITDEMLIGAPAIETVLPAFLSFAGSAVLVGHEASFDLRFLEPELRRLGLPSLAASRSILDTRLLSRSLHGPGESHSIEAIARRLGVTVIGRHSALGDALTTAEILVRLLVLLQKRGVLTLGDALDAVRDARRVIV